MERKVLVRTQLRCCCLSEMCVFSINGSRCTLSPYSKSKVWWCSKNDFYYTKYYSNGCKFHLQWLRFVGRGFSAITNLHEFHWHSYTHWFHNMPTSTDTKNCHLTGKYRKHRAFINNLFNFSVSDASKTSHIHHRSTWLMARNEKLLNNYLFKT